MSHERLSIDRDVISGNFQLKIDIGTANLIMGKSPSVSGSAHADMPAQLGTAASHGPREVQAQSHLITLRIRTHGLVNPAISSSLPKADRLPLTHCGSPF